MRWPYQKLRIWDRRTVRRFALFPVATRDGVVVWMEFYWQEQHHWEGTWFDDDATITRRAVLPGLFDDPLLSRRQSPPSNPQP